MKIQFSGEWQSSFFSPSISLVHSIPPSHLDSAYPDPLIKIKYPRTACARLNEHLHLVQKPTWNPSFIEFNVRIQCGPLSALQSGYCYPSFCMRHPRPLSFGVKFAFCSTIFWVFVIRFTGLRFGQGHANCKLWLKRVHTIFAFFISTTKNRNYWHERVRSWELVRRAHFSFIGWLLLYQFRGRFQFRFFVRFLLFSVFDCVCWVSEKAFRHSRCTYADCRCYCEGEAVARQVENNSFISSIIIDRNGCSCTHTHVDYSICNATETYGWWYGNFYDGWRVDGGTNVALRETNRDDDWLQMVCHTYLRLSSIRRWLPPNRFQLTKLLSHSLSFSRSPCVRLQLQQKATGPTMQTGRKNKTKRKQEKSDSPTRAKAIRQHCTAVCACVCVAVANSSFRFIKKSMDQCETANLVDGSSIAPSSLPIANYRPSSSWEQFAVFIVSIQFHFFHSLAFASIDL